MLTSSKVAFVGGGGGWVGNLTPLKLKVNA